MISDHELDVIERTAGRMYEGLKAAGWRNGLETLSESVPALVAEVRELRRALRIATSPPKPITLPEDEPGIW